MAALIVAAEGGHNCWTVDGDMAVGLEDPKNDHQGKQGSKEHLFCLRYLPTKL